jgi:hypothetical protein
VTTLDSFVKEKNLPRVDFIKADIEGAECAMLLGAAETIRKFRPKMALCIYHRASTDHWLVPETLLSICPNYRFHLKQYRDNHLETVLFCEPTEKPIDRAFDRERLRAFSELYRKTQLQLLKKTNKPQIANVASVAAKLTGQRFSWKFDSYNAWARAPLSFSENSYYQINPYGSDRFAVELHFRKLDEYAEDTRRTIRGLFDELKKHYASFTFTSRANDIFGGFTVRREPDADVSEAVGHEFARLIAETLPFLEKHGLICGRNAIDSVRDRFAKAINAS